MTFEKLVKIIVEVVTKYLFLERQKVLAICFDEVNKAALMEAAQSINGRADCFSGGEIERVVDAYDVMFVDYIRFPDAAEAALGLAFSPWGRLMGNMLSQGKPVFQLKKTPGSRELSPAYRAVLKGYWKQLYDLGVRLLDSDAGRRHLLCSQPFVPVEAVVEPVETTGMTVFSSPFDKLRDRRQSKRRHPDSGGTGNAVKAEAVYTGNVLSRKELVAYANEGRLVIGKDVVITDLAADTAKFMNIDIVRRK